MNDDNKKQTDRQSSDMAEKPALSDQELKDVAGGFTLFDTCQNHWNTIICMAAWGNCPHLILKKTGEKLGTNTDEYYYKVSCTKGCFQDVPTTLGSDTPSSHLS